MTKKEKAEIKKVGKEFGSCIKGCSKKELKILIKELQALLSSLDKK